MFLLAPATSLFGFQFHPLQFHRFQSKKQRPKLQSLCQPFPKILLKKISCPWNAESTANATVGHQSPGADLEPDKTTPRQGFSGTSPGLRLASAGFCQTASAEHLIDLSIRTVALRGGWPGFELGSRHLISGTKFDYTYRPQFWPRASFQDYSIVSI